MASDINAVFIIGRLTADPELKTTQSGSSMCLFSIANNKTYVSGGEKQSQVSYFNCVAWGKIGEVIAEYCRKGMRVGIEGRLQQTSWEGRDGEKKRSVNIVIEQLQMLDYKKDEKKEKPNPSFPEQVDNQSPFTDEDIPF